MCVFRTYRGKQSHWNIYIETTWPAVHQQNFHSPDMPGPWLCGKDRMRSSCSARGSKDGSLAEGSFVGSFKLDDSAWPALFMIFSGCVQFLDACLCWSQGQHHFWKGPDAGKPPAGVLQVMVSRQSSHNSLLGFWDSMASFWDARHCGPLSESKHKVYSGCKVAKVFEKEARLRRSGMSFFKLSLSQAVWGCARYIDSHLEIYSAHAHNAMQR